MKTNMIHTNSIKTYISAIVLMLGFSVNAWGAGEYDVTINNSLTHCSEQAGNPTTFKNTATSTLTLYYTITSGYTGEGATLSLLTGSSEVSEYYYGWEEYTTGVYKLDIYLSYITISSNQFYINISCPTDCTSQGVIVTDNSDEDEGEGDYGTLTSFNLSVASDGSGAVTWSTSDANVATVSGNNSTATVTVVGAGLVDITASVAADATYCAGEGTYSLLVNAVAPTLSSDATGKALDVSEISSTSAKLTGGIVTNKGGDDLTQYGFVVGTSSSVTKDTEGRKMGGWESDIELNTAFGTKTVINLSPNTTYYVRPFAYNGHYYGYGDAVPFKTLKQFAIDLDGNGGSDGIAAVEENAAELIEITAPTRDHYTLEGYYTTSECDTKIANTAGELVASITVGGNNWTDGDGKWIRNTDETFYANWTPDNQTISFNNNGGSGSMDNVVRAYNTTYNLPACTFTAPDGKVFDGWAEGSAEGTVRAVGYSHTVTGNITFYAKWRDGSYTDAKFSCADWTLTGPSGDIVFITSAASKTVRSQEAFHVSGNGLPHSTALTFTTFPVNTKFEFKKADGTIPQTNEFGVVDADVYAFYTPDAGDTSDGLDELTSLTVSVTGEPRTATIDTKRIIGRHLPANFVIAAKYNKKWYALPADMNELSNPIPVEIAVDDSENPTVAYTANTNIYNLYGQNTGAGGKLYTDGQTVKLGMKNNSNKPLFASTTGTYTIKGDGNATVTNNISSQYWWTLRQTNTSITNCQDAKYEVKPSANDRPLMAWFADGGYKWGLYPAKGAKGIEELRLIPASDIVFTEAYFVEWAQHGGVVEVDAQGVAATSVVAHLNGASSAAITLVQTKASDAKNKSSKYNYTVNFGNGIDFAAAASNGALLRLEWKNGATVKAMTSLVVPKIIAASSTLSSHGATDGDWSSAEVHVLPGVTLTANAGDFSSNDVLINHLEIYPGATVKVTKGEAESGTLKVKTLVLRNGWTRASGKEYDVARLYITPSTASMAKNAVSDVWYSDWYIDYDQYYPVAVPWDVTLSGITYRYCSVEPSVGPSKNIRLKYYDGESRATNVQEGVGSGANWKTYGDAGCTDVPTKLEPSKGYAMTAKRPTGKAFSIIRMPLTIPNASWTTAGEQGEVSGTHKDQVSVTAWGTGSTPTYAQGWNLIANPYMSLHQGAITYTGSGTTVRYVNIPDVDFKEYDQFATATAMLKPASAFLIQAPETGTITFGTENRKASAPSYRTEEKPESIPEQQAYIVLSNEQSEDMMGLLVADKFTEAYETNADLEKLLSDGNTLRTYMRYGDMNMAYVAINEMLAKEWIPVSVRIPADGEYTFSLHEASKVSELEGVYLIDYANGDHVTNLIEQSYTFSSTAGTINGRFSINAKTGERQTPTGIDAINAGGDLNSDKPFKFIYHDKVYIWLNGVIYDTTGKRVK